MAFYTAIDQTELLTVLGSYGIVALDSCDGASDGIENSTYFLRHGEQQWILTLFEDLAGSELPFFVRLMGWLHERQLPVACPLANRDGQAVQSLSGKPALLFPRLPGQHPRQPTVSQCRTVGDFLGRMHAVSIAYPEQRANPRGTDWMAEAAQRLRGHLDAEGDDLLAGQLANARQLRGAGLPCGLVHADLFHDNALFVGEQLTGVIDFYNACTDLLALDLAITINDWAGLPGGGIDPARTAAILSGYGQHRQLTAAEQAAWGAILQLAATRFWLSRLLAEKLPRRPGFSHPHKPSAEYRERLKYHLQAR